MQQQKKQPRAARATRGIVRYKERSKSSSNQSASSKRKKPKLIRRSRQTTKHIAVSNGSRSLDLPSAGRVPLKFGSYQESSRSSSSLASSGDLQRRLERLKGYKHITNCSQRVNRMQALWRQESILREQAIKKNQEADKVLSDLEEALFGKGDWGVRNNRLK